MSLYELQIFHIFHIFWQLCLFFFLLVYYASKTSSFFPAFFLIASMFYSNPTLSFYFPKNSVLKFSSMNSYLSLIFHPRNFYIFLNSKRKIVLAYLFSFKFIFYSF